MKTPLKLAAVASSALLVAGFVSYRAGAFDWLSPRPEALPAGDLGETMFPSSKRAEIARPTDAPGEITTVNPAMLSGSKSGVFIVRPPSAAPGSPGLAPDPAPKAPPAFIGGSKSLAPLIPPKGPPAQSPPPAEPK